MPFAWPDRSYALLEAALSYEHREPLFAVAPFAINRVNVERFESFVLRGPGCHEWQGHRMPTGYGVFYLDRRIVYAHRFAWQRLHGPIATEQMVCHKCDNPPCCRDDHHFLGTAKENTADSIAKGKRGVGCERRLTADQRVELTKLAVFADAGERLALAARFAVSYMTVLRYARRAA